MNIIAELGSNPAAYGWQFAEFCRAAKAAGATAVKVQLWKTDLLYPPHMRDNRRPLEFPRERLKEFVAIAHANALTVGASVFDIPALELATRHCDFIKLAASQQGNTALYRACTMQPRPLIRSVSSASWIWDRLSNTETTLWTVPQYPAGMGKSLAELLKAAYWFRRYGIKNWGWSSHTAAPGLLDCVTAKWLGAQTVEKHFCLDCYVEDEGRHSLEPHEFKKLSKAIQ